MMTHNHKQPKQKALTTSLPNVVCRLSFVVRIRIFRDETEQINSRIVDKTLKCHSSSTNEVLNNDTVRDTSQRDPFQGISVMS